MERLNKTGTTSWGQTKRTPSRSAPFQFRLIHLWGTFRLSPPRPPRISCASRIVRWKMIPASFRSVFLADTGGFFWSFSVWRGAGWPAARCARGAPIGITIEAGKLEMAKLANKKQILDDAGYRYDFDRSLYFNRRAKKAFSVEFIDDKAEGELKERIAQKNDGREWLFFLQ